MTNRQRHYPGLNPPPTTRHLLWALATFAAGFAGAFVGGVSGAYLARTTGVDRAGLIAIGVLVGGVIASVAIFYIGLVKRCGWGRRECGFVPPAHSLWHLVWWIPLTIVLAALGAFLVASLLGMESTPSNPSTSGLGLGSLAIVVVVVCTDLVIPFFEEVIFRRVLLDWLAVRLPLWVAAVVTTVLFTVAHGIPSAMIYVVFIGTSLIIARLWFKSLWATLPIHMANNFTVTLIALLLA